MLKRISSLLVVAGVMISTTAMFTMRAPRRGTDPGVTVHEWGTFTSVAGTDGRAMEWLPLGGPTDLPCFVHRLGKGLLKVWPGVESLPIDYQTARQGLWGKVRMETPVLYFYSEQDARLSVRVDFPRGLITEFYPSPWAVQFEMTANSLRDPNTVGFIEWHDVQVGPSSHADFPNTGNESHYYAARATDASPVQVGDQHEKFLFYRGVAGFDVPIGATALGDGGVALKNLGVDGPLPNVVLFENRGGRIGYRINGALADGASIPAPILDGSLPALRAELVSMLIEAGLNQKEAAAMVETWRDSWFEEGTRVFYILPSRSVDAILPLHIAPAPTNIARVFVGRMEVITPATLGIVGRALAGNDTATLRGYGRFLSPITERIAANGADATTSARIHQTTDAVFTNYIRRDRTCQ